MVSQQTSSSPDQGEKLGSTKRKAQAKLEPKQGQPCSQCGAKLATIRISVEGSDLIMESCDHCDLRRWKLAGERIDLERALSEVEQQVTRRR